MGESDFWIACPLTDFDSMCYYESVQPIIYHKPLPPQHLPFPNHPIPVLMHTHCHLHPNMTSSVMMIPWQPPPPHATTLAKRMRQQPPRFACHCHHLHNNLTPQSFLPTTMANPSQPLNNLPQHLAPPALAERSTTTSATSTTISCLQPWPDERASHPTMPPLSTTISRPLPWPNDYTSSLPTSASSRCPHYHHERRLLNPHPQPWPD